MCWLGAARAGVQGGRGGAAGGVVAGPRVFHRNLEQGGVAWRGVAQTRRRRALHYHDEYADAGERTAAVYISIHQGRKKYTPLPLDSYCNVQPVPEQFNIELNTPGGATGAFLHHTSHTCSTEPSPHTPNNQSHPSRPFNPVLPGPTKQFSAGTVLVPSPLADLPSFPHSLPARQSSDSHS
ncbi:hypothetical protein E2C01_049693 [Portunus trituberculatus]|uniref:Uncharacterized protein n=1 Tax=Portunus trituberculatus TaxID=210409 RepID=A0A5B7G6A5_PORTR|nr:hypothetical protein [Portunus trituberculatus]